MRTDFRFTNSFTILPSPSMIPLFSLGDWVLGVGLGDGVESKVGGLFVEQSMKKQMFLSLGTAPWESARRPKTKTTLLFIVLTSNDTRYATSH